MYNSTSKQHEWKEEDIKQEKLTYKELLHFGGSNPFVWEIVTPDKGLLTIRNYPLVTFGQTGERDMTKLSPCVQLRDMGQLRQLVDRPYVTEETKQSYKELVTKWPHFAYLICNNERFFHPIEKQWCYLETQMGGHHFDIFFPLVQVDIMNTILEFDRQNKMVTMLEHIALRPTEDEIKRMMKKDS